MVGLYFDLPVPAVLVNPPPPPPIAEAAAYKVAVLKGLVGHQYLPAAVFLSQQLTEPTLHREVSLLYFHREVRLLYFHREASLLYLHREVSLPYFHREVSLLSQRGKSTFTER